jgi:EmrB/QacA subfamily drug resistance transporter
MHAKLSKWWIFLVTTCGTSLVFLDTTVIPVALPTIQKELFFDPIGLVWIVNAYLLSLTAFLLVGGRLCDLFGKRLLLLWGFILIGIGSILGAMSHAQWLLLVARIVQGGGGALTIPATSALLISTFPRGERARAIGINTGISAIFLVLGPALGGFLTEYLSWRSVFVLNLPLITFGIVMVLVMLQSKERKRESFHFTGTFTMLAAVVTLVLGLMQGNMWGWITPETLALLIITPLLFFLFVRMSLNSTHPLIDFRFFRIRLFTAANLSIFITQIIVMVTVLWAIYFQEQLGYSPSETGLLIFVAAFPVFLMAPLGGYFADRCGPRLPMLLGFAILTFALFWLLMTAHSGQIWILLPGLLGFGFSLPLIMSPTVALALSEIDPEKLGAASGITTVTRQIASTTGIALMTAVYLRVVKVSNSHIEAFSAISLLAGLLAFVGFWLVFWIIRPASKT